MHERHDTTTTEPLAGETTPVRTLLGGDMAGHQARAGQAGRAADSRCPAPLVTALPQDAIIHGVSSFCEVVSCLALVRDAAQGSPIHARLNSVMGHLEHAAADLPDELWAVFLLDRCVGGEEVIERFKRIIEGARS